MRVNSLAEDDKPRLSTQYRAVVHESRSERQLHRVRVVRFARSTPCLNPSPEPHAVVEAQMSKVLLLADRKDHHTCPARRVGYLRRR